MTQIEAYKEYNGSTIFGKGVVRESTIEDRTNYKYVFENKTGRTFFNPSLDGQAKGIKLLTNLELV